MTRRRITLHIDRITAPGPISRVALADAIRRELGERLAQAETPLSPTAASHRRVSEPGTAGSPETALGHAVARAAMGVLKP